MNMINKIDSHQKQVRKSVYSFAKVLKLFGFKTIKDQKGCYSKGNWYAEIIDHGGWHSVWMIGEGLKDSKLFPGGWIYSEPSEVADELQRALTIE